MIVRPAGVENGGFVRSLSSSCQDLPPGGDACREIHRQVGAPGPTCSCRRADRGKGRSNRRREMRTAFSGDPEALRRTADAIRAGYRATEAEPLQVLVDDDEALIAQLRSKFLQDRIGRRRGLWHRYFTRGNFVSVSVCRNATTSSISESVSFRFPISCLFTFSATSGAGQPAEATSRVL